MAFPFLHGTAPARLAIFADESVVRGTRRGAEDWGGEVCYTRLMRGVGSWELGVGTGQSWELGVGSSCYLVLGTCYLVFGIWSAQPRIEAAGSEARPPRGSSWPDP